jgi:hypothetical protein
MTSTPPHLLPPLSHYLVSLPTFRVATPFTGKYESCSLTNTSFLEHVILRGRSSVWSTERTVGKNFDSEECSLLEKRIASIIRVETTTELGKTLATSCQLLLTVLVRYFFHRDIGGDTSVLTRAARRHNPEDDNPHSHRREDLKFYKNFDSHRISKMECSNFPIMSAIYVDTP